ncbi:BEM_HP_G0080050.mRNA.1.CDS.1 [Saccharomyces cerevisiae]|nr:BEM_HP_G0080050.mRNA.1.CDS.1 [Saccharomyces cerevisiae]CAI6991859.1 BEM_HP_G0080050.mRNA.1.CDS.1 [Saccharomyces cerevisiae]
MGKRKLQDVHPIVKLEICPSMKLEVGRRGQSRFRRYGDEDELNKNKNRRKRAALDKEFKYFADAIAEASNGLLICGEYI